MSDGKKELIKKIKKQIKLCKKDAKHNYDDKHKWWMIGRIQSLEDVLDWIEIEL